MCSGCCCRCGGRWPGTQEGATWSVGRAWRAMVCSHLVLVSVSGVVLGVLLLDPFPQRAAEIAQVAEQRASWRRRVQEEPPGVIDRDSVERERLRAALVGRDLLERVSAREQERGERDVAGAVGVLHRCSPCAVWCGSADGYGRLRRSPSYRSRGAAATGCLSCCRRSPA